MKVKTCHLFNDFYFIDLEDTCSEFVYEKDVGYPGNDIRNHNITYGLPECEDLCRAEATCVGFSADPVNLSNSSLPGQCWIKSAMDSPKEAVGKYSARFVQYDCRDNHNCGSSFVEFRDHNLGQGVGQKRHYCGHETPPDFFSYGPDAQVITALDSQAEGIKPYFEAKYHAEVCNRVHSEPNGLITAPMKGGFYQPNMDCNIQIKTPVTTKIQIYFNTFDIENSENCQNDYLQIKYGILYGLGLWP